MRSVVTGADGFVGRWLISHLTSMGDEVIPAGGPNSARANRLNVTDAEQVRHLLRDAHPEAVYHLAGMAHGPTSAADPAKAVEITVAGTANLLIAAGALSRKPIVLIASSSEVYRPPRRRVPLRESHPVDPRSIYGATKASQEMVARALGRLHDVPIIIARSFNQIGPGQREDFVAAAFALQLSRVALGLREPVLEVGNLSAQRDFVDVRDAVTAFRALVIARDLGPFNICTGQARRVGDLLDALVHVSEVRAEIRVDAKRLRRVDVPYLAGDPRKVMSTTGWQPSKDFMQTMTDIWAEALQRTKAAVPIP